MKKIYMLLCLCILTFSLLIGCTEKVPTTKTIYVSTSISANYPDSLNDSTNLFFLNDSGFPIRTKLEYADPELTPVESTYVYNYDGLAEQIVDFFHDYAATSEYWECTLDDDELKPRYEEIQKKLNELLSSQTITNETDISYQIVDIQTDGSIPYIYTCPREFDLVHDRPLFLYYTVQFYNNGTAEKVTSYNCSNVLWSRTKFFDSNGKLSSFTSNHPFNGNYTYTTDYSYESDGENQEIVQTTTTISIEGTVKEVTHNTYHRHDFHDENGCLTQRTSYDINGEKYSDTYYEYQSFDIPVESVDLLCNIYNYLGITYYLAD